MDTVPNAMFRRHDQLKIVFEKNIAGGRTYFLIFSGTSTLQSIAPVHMLFVSSFAYSRIIRS